MSDTDNRHPDKGHDRGPTNDSQGRAVAPPRATTLATTSLTELAANFKGVVIPIRHGRSGLPMLQFKSRPNQWSFGQKQIVPEPDASWAVNIRSFAWGWISWGEGNRILGEEMVAYFQPMPNVAELPDTGFKWQAQRSVGMKCLDGADAGTEVVFKTTTVGGLPEVDRLFEVVRDRLVSGQHDNKMMPVVRLESDSYPHPDYGRTYTPVLNIVDWVPLDGPQSAPAPVPEPPVPPSPAPASAAEAQPRRRRRVA
jgi:hypothetical protein